MEELKEGNVTARQNALRLGERRSCSDDNSAKKPSVAPGVTGRGFNLPFVPQIVS